MPNQRVAMAASHSIRLAGQPARTATNLARRLFRPRSNCFDIKSSCRTGDELHASALVALDLIERHSAISGVLARKAEHAFADDVARDLGGAAAQRRRLP